jgi:hypothetical protein
MESVANSYQLSGDEQMTRGLGGNGKTQKKDKFLNTASLKRG